MRSERRPSPEETRLLLVCTISSMSKWSTNRTMMKNYETKRRKEGKRAKTKRAILCPAGGPRLLLLVDEARLHVKDVAVRFAGLLYLLACSMHAISSRSLGSVDSIRVSRVVSAPSLRFLLNVHSCVPLSRFKLFRGLREVCRKAMGRTGGTVKPCASSSSKKSSSTRICSHWQSCTEQADAALKAQRTPKIYIATGACPDINTAGTWAWSSHVRCSRMCEYRQRQSEWKPRGVNMSHKQQNDRYQSHTGTYEYNSIATARYTSVVSTPLPAQNCT